MRRSMSSAFSPGRWTPLKSVRSAFRGRRKWSSDRAARPEQPSPPAVRRPSTAWRSISPAARTTRNTRAVPATACSTMWRSPRASCRAKPQAGDACSGSRLSTSTCTRAMGPHRFCEAILRCSRCRFMRHRTFHSASKPAHSTSDWPTALATKPTLRHSAKASQSYADVSTPQLLIYVSGADAHEGDRLGKLEAVGSRDSGARSCDLRIRRGARRADCRHDGRRLWP